jgi:hypothetical protein
MTVEKVIQTWKTSRDLRGKLENSDEWVVARVQSERGRRCLLISGTWPLETRRVPGHPEYFHLAPPIMAATR